jgi:protein-disulfide isomerase
LCQKDRGKAFEEVMKGKHDGGKYETCADADVDSLMKIHESAAAKMGIKGTPFFIVGDETVSGADISKLQRLLTKEAGKM